MYLVSALRFILSCALMLSVVFTLANTHTAYAQEASTPLSIEELFKDEQFTRLKISPTGEYLAFSFVEGTEVKFGILNRKTKALTASFGFGDYTKVANFHWATDDRVLVEYVYSVGFLDNQATPPTLVAMDADGDNRSLLFQGIAGFGEVPIATYRILNLLEDDPEHILIERRHARDSGNVRAYRINIFNADSDYTAEEPSNVNQIVSDANGKIRGALRVEFERDSIDGQVSILYRSKDGDKWSELDLSQYKRDDRIRLLGFTQDQKSLLYKVQSNVTESIDDLFALDLDSGKSELLFSTDTAEISYPIGGTEGIIAVSHMPDIEKFEFLDQSRQSKIIQQLGKSFPGHSVIPTSFSKDGGLMTFQVYSDQNAGDYYLFDFEKMNAEYLASRRPHLDPENMAELKPIQVTTRDGLELHGYLALPKNSSKNNPLIVNPHGGPHGPRDVWGFDPEVQFLTSRGYAVLRINFRGSGGYGQAFERSGYGKWGQEMQNDLTDSVMWAIEEGYVDKDRICIYGGSYGGYAALMSAVREPDLYKCTVGYVGVYSMPVMKESGDIPRTRQGRRVLDRYLGTDEEALIENSPAYHVDKIKAAIKIVHSGSDVRVPMAQYEAISEQLKKHNIPYESMVKEEEGHGFTQYKNKVELYYALEAFFDKHIGASK